MTHRTFHRVAESSEDDGMLSPMFSMELDPSKLGENYAASSRAPADGRRWRPPASRPGMGPIGGRDWHRNAMGFDGMDDMDSVWQTCRPASAFEERLATNVAACKDQCRVGGGDVALRILGNMLRERGYHIEVMDRNTGRTGHHDVWHHLRHSYLVCTGWSDNTTVAIPEFPSQEVIIDVGFRERFEVAHATLAYERLLQVVPEDFVGGRDQLKRVVRIMCDQMASSFKQCGLLLPPWRTYRAVLSMWSGPQAHGLQRGGSAKKQP